MRQLLASLFNNFVGQGNATINTSSYKLGKRHDLKIMKHLPFHRHCVPLFAWTFHGGLVHFSPPSRTPGLNSQGNRKVWLGEHITESSRLCNGIDWARGYREECCYATGLNLMTASWRNLGKGDNRAVFRLDWKRKFFRCVNEDRCNYNSTSASELLVNKGLKQVTLYFLGECF